MIKFSGIVFVIAFALVFLPLETRAQNEIFVDLFDSGTACSIVNWDEAFQVADGNAGEQSAGSNRRYSARCGLRLTADAVSFLSDNSPNDETNFNVRFYAFLEDLEGTEPALLFSADSGNFNGVIEVWYNVPAGNDLTLRVADSNEVITDLTHAAIGGGWHSIEIAWSSGPDSSIRFAHNSDDPADDQVAFVDTESFLIDRVSLGLINGDSLAGFADFDAYDSRRGNTRPGRLLVGDANGDGQINALDFVTVTNEFNEVLAFAAGQPDCNEDGVIDDQDVACIINLMVQP